MIADAAFALPAARPDGAAPRPGPDDAVVALDADAAGENHHALWAALADAAVLVDVAAATPAQRRTIRRILPAERIVAGAPPGIGRAHAASLVAQSFAGHGRDQEPAHQRLRAQILARVAPAWTRAPLPSPREVGMMALVVVRRDYARSARAMTPENLRRVVEALACLGARPAPRERLTHALVCGELFPGELGALGRALAGRVQLGWLAARVAGGEAALLAGLARLRERYRDALFATGFAGAALDGAALVGIPSFYFDESTAARWHEWYADGRYLVDARRDAEAHERRLTLTRAVDALIRINLAGGPGQRDREQRLFVDEHALADLLTAVRVWSARDLPGAHRNWSARVALCRGGLARLRFDAVRARSLADARRIG